MIAKYILTSEHNVQETVWIFLMLIEFSHGQTTAYHTFLIH